MAFLVALIVAVPSTSAARPGRLTAAEQRRLERGRIVRRPLADDRRGLVGGTSWIVVDAPIETVWRTLSSLPSYRMMFPRTERIQLLEQEGARRLVRIEQEETVGTFTWVVAIAVDERRHEVRFRLDRNHQHVVDDGWGYVKLTPHGDAGARTLVTFGAVVDPGDDALVQDLLDDRAERRMLGMPRRLKRQVEGERPRRVAPAPPTVTTPTR